LLTLSFPQQYFSYQMDDLAVMPLASAGERQGRGSRSTLLSSFVQMTIEQLGAPVSSFSFLKKERDKILRRFCR
jgi:hypothetical protein